MSIWIKGAIVGRNAGSALRRCYSYNFDGRVVLITGGSLGIGLDFARILLEKNIKGVVLADVNDKDGMDAAKKFGQKAIYLKTDVSKKSDMEACFNETLKKFGTIDIVINNAGILDEERYELLIDTNIKGVIYGTLLGFKHMGKHRKGKGGIVVNVASIVGVRQFAGFPVYTGTKHFVIGFSRAIGSPFYYDNTGVKILSILPGFTETVLIHKVPTLKEFEELKLNEYTNNKIATFAAQPVSFCSEVLIDLINKGENGSTWITELSKPGYEVKPVTPTIF